MGLRRLLAMASAAALLAACGTESDTVPDPEPSCELSIDCSGPLCPTVVYASDGKMGSDLAALDVEGGFVYFQRPGGTVWRVPVEGGEAERLVAWTGQSGGTLLAAEEGVYYVIEGTLTFWPAGGKTLPVALAQLQYSPARIVSDANDVYVTSKGDPVLVVSRDTLDVTLLPGSGALGPNDLAVDDDEIYIASSDLIAVSKATGQSRVVIPEASAQRIAVSGDRIYWSPHGLEIKSALEDGTDVRTEVAHRVSEFVTSGGTIYWLGESVPFTTSGSAGGLLVDGGSLWWRDGDGHDGPCAVLRLELPPP